MKIFYRHIDLPKMSVYAEDSIICLRQVQPNDNLSEIWKRDRKQGLNVFEVITYTLVTGATRIFDYRENCYSCKDMKDAMVFCGITDDQQIGGYFSSSHFDPVRREMIRTFVRHHIASHIFQRIGLRLPVKTTDVNYGLTAINRAKMFSNLPNEMFYNEILKLENHLDMFNGCKTRRTAFNSQARWTNENNEEKEDSAMKTEINIGVAIVAPQKKDSEIIKVIADAGKKITVVKFADNSVEVIKCSKDDDYDVYVGVALAKARHEAGSNTAFHKAVDKLLVNVKPKVKKVKKPEPKKSEKEPNLKGPKGRKGIGAK